MPTKKQKELKPMITNNPKLKPYQLALNAWMEAHQFKIDVSFYLISFAVLVFLSFRYSLWFSPLSGVFAFILFKYVRKEKSNG